MLHPVGKLPPAVYWRRRLIFVLLPALLVLLMVVYLFSGGDSNQSAAGSTSPSARPPATSPAPAPSLASATTVSRSPAATTATAGRMCTAADLRVQAATGKSSFAVGTRPDLYLVVTNISATPCKQDLADKQIVLLIYIGDVRVWGSHDCKIEPGVDVATLNPKVTVRRGILWSGQTSAAGCQGVRLIAQAGNYALTAVLAGQTSAPVGFSLTATG